MNRHHLATLCSVLAGLLGLCAPPCEAGSRFLEHDYGHESVHLESPSTVTTWEDGAGPVAQHHAAEADHLGREGAGLHQVHAAERAPPALVEAFDLGQVVLLDVGHLRGGAVHSGAIPSLSVRDQVGTSAPEGRVGGAACRPRAVAFTWTSRLW